jgi:hypothetical protein
MGLHSQAQIGSLTCGSSWPTRHRRCRASEHTRSGPNTAPETAERGSARFPWPLLPRGSHSSSTRRPCFAACRFQLLLDVSIKSSPCTGAAAGSTGRLQSRGATGSSRLPSWFLRDSDRQPFGWPGSSG